jgi:hypothetical protein
MVRVEGTNEAHVIRTLLEFGQEIRYCVAGLPTGLELEFFTLVGTQQLRLLSNESQSLALEELVRAKFSIMFLQFGLPVKQVKV